MMWVSLSKLSTLVNPVQNPPWADWKSGPLDKDSILQCHVDRQPKEYNPLIVESKNEHIYRIAYYMKYGWNESPICLILREGIYPIWDGVHRVCAALLRGDEGILAQVEGDPLRIKSLYE